MMDMHVRLDRIGRKFRFYFNLFVGIDNNTEVAWNIILYA
jgi:hypothetical protein